MTPGPLTAKIEGSFPYITVKDRLPIILTKVIDHLCREKFKIYKEYGEEVAEELKEIVGLLSQLKNEMQTNKPFTKFLAKTEIDDTDVWNRKHDLYRNKYGEDPKWFMASWLYAECYFYKRIHNVFEISKSFRSFDPFVHQKVESCESSLPSIRFLCEHLMKINLSSDRNEHAKTILLEVLETSLWGNQCDLSLSGGAIVPQEKSPFSRLKEMRENIIVSDEEHLWRYLTRLPQGETQLAIILDNAGLELVADMCLASVMIELKFFSSVVFYPKLRPWFVSDTNLSDFHWTLNYLREQGGDLARASRMFVNYLEKGFWKIREHDFWTGPHVYPEMKKEDPDLYKELSEYSLVIFKGDLNYRKLVGDLDWANETSFRTALGGFLPSSILALRTMKGGPVVGVDEASPRVRKAKRNENWNITGERGIIQFLSDGYSINVKDASLVLITTGLTVLLVSFLIKKFVL